MSKDYSKISEKWKPANRNLGIFILYSRDVSLQPPFAEVLSGLLRAAYWPLVFLCSSFSGLFWPGSFFPSFRIWIPKRCKGVHCVDLGESFPTSIYLQILASIQPITSLVKFARSPRTDPPGASMRLDRVEVKNVGVHMGFSVEFVNAVILKTKNEKF